MSKILALGIKSHHVGSSECVAKTNRVLATLLILGCSTSILNATSGGSGTSLDPYILTTSDTYLNSSGSYYSYKGSLLDYDGVALFIGQNTGNVHLVLDTDGTTVKAQSIRVGYAGGYTNYGDISGGATLYANGSMVVGFNGGGYLTVHDNGTAYCASGTDYVGYNTGSAGFITVTTGSTLYYGAAVSMGYNTGAQGQITVNGSDSRLTCISSIVVGGSGTGSVVLQNGGKASVGTDSYIGYYNGFSGSGGTGSVLMTGGSSWASTNASSSIRLGSYAGSSGSITLSNSGTYLSSAGTINIASSGSGAGTLTIRDGALVVASSSLTPILTGANGVIQLDNGFLAIKSGSQISVATLLSTYNIDVYKDGSWVNATTGDLITEYFNATNPWSSSSLYPDYNSLDLTGYTLVEVPEPALYEIISLAILGFAIVNRRRL